MPTDPTVGVALTKCYFCQKDDKIVINRILTPAKAKMVKEMHNKVIDMEPCQKCREFMAMGVILITIDPEKSGPGWNKPNGEKGWIPNPYRTGGFFVITDDAVHRIFDEDMAKYATKQRWMFIEHEAAETIGLFDAAPAYTDPV